MASSLVPQERQGQCHCLGLQQGVADETASEALPVLLPSRGVETEVLPSTTVGDIMAPAVAGELTLAGAGVMVVAPGVLLVAAPATHALAAPLLSCWSVQLLSPTVNLELRSQYGGWHAGEVEGGGKRRLRGLPLSAETETGSDTPLKNSVFQLLHVLASAVYFLL